MKLWKWKETEVKDIFEWKIMGFSVGDDRWKELRDLLDFALEV